MKYVWLVEKNNPETPLKNMSESQFRIILPNIWKNKIHVPSHQPALECWFINGKHWNPH